MPATIAALLLGLGCAQASFTGPHGAFAVWVCPPAADAPAAPPAPPARAPGEHDV